MGPPLALVACSGAVASTAPDAGAERERLALGQEAGGATGKSGVAADRGACPSRSGYFACGDEVCDRAIQTCHDGACEWYGSLTCGACPTCDCISQTGPHTSCEEDTAGSIVFSHGSCYGSPPARLERID